MKKSQKTKKKVSIKGVDQLKLFGFQDRNLKALESRFDARVVARNGELILEGESQKVTELEKVVYELILMVTRNHAITENDIDTICQTVTANKMARNATANDNDSAVILYTKEGAIKPKSSGQLKFFESAQKNDIVFVIGPAGTGKTFLAVAIAVAALRDRLVSRIVLTRPAVEAGESLGFLPGDLKEKVEPYLKPLYDALHQMIPADKLKKYLETQVIEIVPLAYMRGRTLNNAFVILDEAQNTSFNQMKMFLTRLGINSRAIVTGDITQIDLPHTINSGLVEIQSIVAGIDGIDFVYLSDTDVVRHRLVRAIIKAYEAFETKSSEE